MTKLKLKRLEKGLYRWQVAGKIGVSEQLLYMWEAGKIPCPKKRLKELAKLYGCSIEELEGDEKS